MTILPQLERDLFTAAERQLPARAQTGAPGEATAPAGTPWQSPLRRRARTTLAGLPIAASALVALAIAAIAVGVFGHGGRPSASGAPSRSAARAELLQSLGVVHRPQIAADRDPQLINVAYLRILGAPPGPPTTAHSRRLLARWGDPAPERRLLRVVRVPSLGVHVLVAPTSFRPSAASSQRTDGITIAVTGPGNGVTSDGFPPTSVASLRAHGVALFYGMGGPSNPGVVLVPDGVATVRLSHVAPLPHTTPFTVNPRAITIAHNAPFDVNPRAITTALSALEATGHVTNNLAAFHLPIPTVTTRHRLAHFVTRSGAAFIAIQATAHATWLSPTGNIIRHTTTHLNVLIRIRNRAT